MADVDPERAPDGASPLRPDASIEEIQARVAHLSSGEATSAPMDAPEPGVVPAGGPTPSAGVTPSAGQAGQEAPSWLAMPPEALPSAAARPRRRGLRALIGGGGALLVGLAALALKFGVQLFAVGVAAAALSGAFGDRYSHLPSDQRQGFEQRYQQIIGSSLDGLSDTERTTRLNDLVTKGAGRLDDASLVLWTQLDEKAHASTDTATCATIARGWLGKNPDQASFAAAISKAYDSLSNADYASIVDLNLKAMAAQTNGSPPVRSVSDATIEPVFTALDGAMSSPDSTTLDALANGETVTDAAACSALRDVDAAAAKLTPDQFAAWSVWVSTP